MKVLYHDISTKAKAQEFIGLDMGKIKTDKQEFIETVIPEWQKQADEREKTYDIIVSNKE